MTEYLNDFVQESEESITDLNNALLELERNPEDGDAMDEVFRTAHTLKGNAGAMGFDDASDLAHALEDLLDAIRAGSLEVSPELMDEVFDAVDTLDELIDEVGDHGETRTDPTDRIQALRDWIEETTGLTKPTDHQLERTLAGGSRPRRQHEVFHARLSVPAGEDAGGVVDALQDAFDLLSTDPDAAAIREGDHDGVVDVAFGSVVDEAAIAAALEPVDAVEDAIITEVPDEVIAEALDDDAEPSPAPGGADAGVDPDDMEVDDLLDEFTEYDDLDEAVERVDDVEGLEDMGEAGAFDDIVQDEVTPAHEEGDAEAEAEADAGAPADEESQEVEDVEGTFRELQDEYDQVGLDEMESELEDVSFGEYDEDDEVGFEELIGEGVSEAETGGPAETEEPAEAEAHADAEEPTESEAEEPAETEEPATPEPPALEDPDEDAVEAAVDAAALPRDPDRGVFLLRLSIVEDPDVNNGIRVVEALRDAFDLLATAPTETAIGEGDYEGRFDAVVGSDVGEDQIVAALDAVDEVAATIVREVTDRMPEPADAEVADAVDEEPAVDEVVPEEPDDAQEAFSTLQDEYDQVGLDEMESELEDVSFGEYDEDDEVGFEELIGEEVAEAEEPPEADEPATGEAAAGAEEPAEPGEPTPPEPPTIEDPDEAAVEAAVDAAALPRDPDRGVFLLRLSIVEDPDVNNGIRVVEALRDAFDLLGTVPTETEIGEGDYGGWFDAVVGSDVGEDQIVAALDAVDEVAATIVREVTDRMPEPPEQEADDPGVAAGADAVDEVVPEEPDDAQEAFSTLQDEYDQVGLEEMEQELEGVTFGEYDEDDEVGFEELIGEEPAEAEEPPATEEPPEVEGPTEAEGSEPAEAGEPAAGSGSAPDVEAGEEFGDAEAGEEFGDAEAGEEFGDAEAGEEFGDVEAEDAFGDAEADESFDDVDVDADESFGDVEAGTDEFGDVETGDGFDDAETEVEVGEISIEDEESLAADVDVEEVEAGEAEFGDPDLEDDADEEFGDVDVGEGSDFGEVEPMEPGADVTRDLPDEADDPVDSIRGIGDSYAASLSEAGVETVADLVTADSGTLSGETDISAGRIEEWIDRAPISASDVEAASAPEPDPEEPTPAEPETTEAEPETPTTERELDEIQSVRVDVNRVDELLNLVEEMVTSRARLRRSVQEDAPKDVLEDELDELDVVVSQLQDQVMEMRLVPVQTVTQRLPRVVRDVSRDQGKRVRFETEGEDVEVDRSILNEIGDPLIHLIRNAVDHGIETPDEREAAGKDPEGRITLRASRSRDTVTIEVSDDGRGLDPDELRETAVEEGVISETEAAELSDSDAYDLIFRSGFSTRQEVTDVSGRGVGMDVVANTVDELDGQVTIDSEPGEGTTVRMTLPVTVAISEVVFLEIGGEEYGVPIKVVDEISSMGVAETVKSNGTEAIRTEDGSTKELIRLNEALDTPAPRRTRTGGMLVTVEDDVRSVAIQCDEVRGQQEVVVKPFEGLLSGIPGLSGAAVLGEGDVINILDVETL